MSITMVLLTITAVIMFALVIVGTGMYSRDRKERPRFDVRELAEMVDIVAYEQGRSDTEVWKEVLGEVDKKGVNGVMNTYRAVEGEIVSRYEKVTNHKA